MRLLGILAIALSGAAGPAAAVDISRGVADPAFAEVDLSYEASVARLAGQGYRVVKMVPVKPGVRLTRIDSYKLDAFDPQGSEVLLTISMKDGRVMRTDYVHLSDQ